jgi:CRISPR-associated protein Cas1
LRFFKGSLDFPPRIVLIDGSGNISIDALDWISEQGISLVRISYDGSNAVVLSPNGFAANPERVQWQRETRDSPKLQLAYAIQVTRRKLEASIETLQLHLPPSAYRAAAISSAETGLANLRTRKAKSLSDLLGIEGPTAKAYWRAWQGVEMRWKAKSRYPIPDQWRTYTSRISLNSGKKWKNRNASHPINAMLNYAYAMLLAEMRIKAISDGYDPMLGILHDQRHYEKERTPSFALDLMEPLRPMVDRAVLKLVREETFTGADFVLQSDGVCRLNPNLATLVSAQVSRRLTGAHHNDSKSGNLGRPHGSPTRQQTD